MSSSAFMVGCFSFPPIRLCSAFHMGTSHGANAFLVSDSARTNSRLLIVTTHRAFPFRKQWMSVLSSRTYTGNPLTCSSVLGTIRNTFMYMYAHKHRSKVKFKVAQNQNNKTHALPRNFETSSPSVSRPRPRVAWCFVPVFNLVLLREENELPRGVISRWICLLFVD